MIREERGCGRDRLWCLPGPGEIQIREVVLRDGLQQERIVVPVEKKLELLEALMASGLRNLEIASFVSTEKVPAMADAEELFRRAPRKEGVRLSALVFNERGLERARDAGVAEIAVFVSASEAHSRRNVGMGVRDALREAVAVIRAARKAGMRVRGGVSNAFGCAIQGRIAEREVIGLAGELIEGGVEEVALADTSGTAHPRGLSELLALFREEFGGVPVALHLHDPGGWAFANLLAGLQMGVARFDTSLGGIGGCPFLPGAAGNLSTEQVNAFLSAMGIPTGVDSQGLERCRALLKAILAPRGIPFRP